MHLAICDDHMADRKQMERLLGRESDRRLNTTGVLYVDSFGSKESILTTPMIYDAIFMDIMMPAATLWSFPTCFGPTAQMSPSFFAAIR